MQVIVEHLCSKFRCTKAISDSFTFSFRVPPRRAATVQLPSQVLSAVAGSGVKKKMKRTGPLNGGQHTPAQQRIWVRFSALVPLQAVLQCLTAGGTS